jgi:hypothetical protein
MKGKLYEKMKRDDWGDYYTDKEWLDEAKKEFPVKLTFMEERGHIITLEAHELGIKKLSEAITWYIKWFGDEK